MAIIKTIEIENFQSHAYTKLEIGQGLNVIVGPSDQGKSAIIRALRWLFYNEPRGTDFFRMDSNSCRVTVQLDSGEKIIRERTNSRNRYIYRNAQEEETVFEGFGNSVPWEITKILQMPRILLDKDTETTLNISHQLESPFLLTDSGTLRAKMIGRLTGVHIIDAAIRETAKDLLNQQQEEKRLTGELERIVEELESYNYLSVLLDHISEIEKLLQRIMSSYNRLKLLEEFRDKWNLVCLEEKHAKEVLAILPPVDRVESLLNQSAVIIQRRLQLDRLRNNWKSIEKELGNTEIILQHTQGLNRGENSLVEAESNLKRLKELWQLQGKIRNWKKEYQQTREVWKMLGKGFEADKLVQPIEEKVEILRKLEVLTDSFKEVQRKNSELEEELSGLEGKLNVGLQKYQLKLKETGKCPLCYCPLDEKAVKKIIDNYSMEEESKCL